jgi:cytoskeletal protein RodZ
MNPEDMIFEEFFAERLKHKGLSPKKLAELTGISPRNIKDLASGNFEALPSAPYVRGYLIRLGGILDFDGEDWWQRIKNEGRVKNSGSNDALPQNRFLKKSPARLISIIAVIVIVLIYLGFEFPRIVGRPVITVTYPSTSPFSTDTNLVTLAGTITNGDSISVNGDSATINTDGTWQKNVLLQNGQNTFDIHGKKFLGGQTDVQEEIVYTSPDVPSETSSTTASSTEATSSKPASNR